MRHRANLKSIIAGLVLGTAACAGAARGVEPPVVYAECGSPSLVVVLTDRVAGPSVTVRRPGRPDIATVDVNLAHKSRRLFFKLRDDRGIVEFQGRATATTLDGLWSEGDESRHIRLMAIPTGACEKR